MVIGMFHVGKNFMEGNGCCSHDVVDKAWPTFQSISIAQTSAVVVNECEKNVEYNRNEKKNSLLE